MLTIGFANKYYTLWNVVTKNQKHGHEDHQWVSYEYYKNISTDINKVRELYPGIEINEALKGMTHSWNSAPVITWDNVDTYRFGKYKDCSIEGIGCDDYVAWYWNQVSGEHRAFVGKVLESRGFEVETDENGNQWLWSPEDVKIRKEEAAKKDEFIRYLLNTPELKLFMERNLTVDGIYMDEFVNYKFDCVVREYNGYPYGLPTRNGKSGIRVKGKEINITDYVWHIDGDKVVIEVKDFSVIK